MTIQEGLNRQFQELKPTRLSQRLWSALLRMVGWRVFGEIPQIPKYLLVVAPHTSNLDWFIGFVASRSISLPFPHWIGKHTIFRWPVTGLAHRLGGIPVRRGASYKFVQQIKDAFDRTDQLIIAIAPEGTRKYVDHWKSGFYYIASNAEVPFVLVSLDYRTRTVIVYPTEMPTRDQDADMARIRQFYDGVEGRNPEQQAPVRLARVV